MDGSVWMMHSFSQVGPDLCLSRRCGGFMFRQLSNIDNEMSSTCDDSGHINLRILHAGVEAS